VFGDFEQRRLLRELQRESDIGSALVGVVVAANCSSPRF